MLSQVHQQQRAAQRAVPVQRHGAIRVAASVHGAAGAAVAKAMQHTVARRRWQRQERALRKGITVRSGTDAASTEAPKPPAPKAFLPGACCWWASTGRRSRMAPHRKSAGVHRRPQPASNRPAEARCSAGTAALSQPHPHSQTCAC